MSVNEENWIQTLVTWLVQDDETPFPGPIRDAIEASDTADLESVVGVLSAYANQLALHPTRSQIALQQIAGRVHQLRCSPDFAPDESLISPATVRDLYEQIYTHIPRAAAHTMQILAAQGDDESLEILTELLRDAPPQDWESTAIALNALWSATPQQLKTFFDHLGDQSFHPTTMSVLLDLGNYSVRTAGVSAHPWQNRLPALTSLLGSVTNRLGILEKDPTQFGDSVQEVQNVLSESIALTVSLCDAIGLIGQPDSIDELRNTLNLSHRRIQTEASGALARLGDEFGRNRLIQLAEDRVARLRAVTYADELGFADEISASLRMPQALAESELASWLASPEQFGIPPANMEIVDSCTQHWPSYEEPQNCFLFRFSYAVSDVQISNVGIAGPCTFAFNADLANLPADDIYAAFAGWNVEHEDIYEIPPGAFNPAQLREAEQLINYLHEHGFEHRQTVALAFMLGEIALVCLTEREAKRLCTVTDGVEMLSFPVTDAPHSMSPEVALCIFRGRKLLRTFNA